MRVDRLLTPAMRTVVDAASFETLMDDPGLKAQALQALSAFTGLDLQAPRDGSAIVGLAADRVVKVMAPHDVHHHHVEVAALTALHDRLPVPTPKLLSVIDWEGWSGVVMERLAGVPLDTVWATLPRQEQLSIASQLGEMLAALHGLQAPPEIPRVDWAAWCADRIPAVEDVQRAKKTPEALLSGLRTFLERTDTTPGDVGWLHTEIMPAHLLVSETDSGWRITGLFDFEPSWVGPVDYEYAAVGVFFGAGDAEVFGAVQRAAGRSIEPQRLFAMAAVHRYANLRWYHERLGGPADDLQQLAKAWFSAT